MAGSLQNSSGVNSGNRSSAGYSHTSVDVLSKININNNVHVKSYSEDVTIDLAGVNGRLMHRDKGHAHYSEHNGGSAAGGALEGEHEFIAAGGGGSYHVDGSESNTQVNGQGDLDIYHANDEDFNFNAEAGGRQTPFSGEGELHASGDHSESEELDVHVDFEGSGSHEESSYSSDGGGGFIYTEGDGEIAGNGAETGSGARQGWKGKQSETAVDGSIAGSLAFGWTSVKGDLTEKGFTKTTVHVDSFEVNNGFEKSASSFNGANWQ